MYFSLDKEKKILEMKPIPNQAVAFAEYCIANSCRTFDGISYGRIDFPDEVPQKRARLIYRDEQGIEWKKKDLAKKIGISESSITRLYADFYYDHEAVYEFLRQKKEMKDKPSPSPHCKRNIRPASVFKFNNGEKTDSVILSEHYGVSRQFISRTYIKHGGDSVRANKAIETHLIAAKKKEPL